MFGLSKPNRVAGTLTLSVPHKSSQREAGFKVVQSSHEKHQF